MTVWRDTLGAYLSTLRAATGLLQGYTPLSYPASEAPYSTLDVSYN